MPAAVENGTNGEGEQKPTTEVNGQKANGKKKGNKGKGKGKGKSEGSSEGQSKERIQRLDQLYSKKKRQTYFVPTPKSDAGSEKPGQSAHVVLKVRRIICDKGFPTSTEIDIKSTLLKDALSEILEGAEGLSLNESQPVASPEVLFHARKGLQEKVELEQAKEPPNKVLIDELDQARRFIAEDYGSTLETLALLSVHDEITFDLLWTLFPPTTTVYTKENLLREDQLLKLKTSDYGRRQNGARFFELNLQLISHDGANAGWVDSTIVVEHFEGAKKIHTLKCFPLACHPDKGDVRGQLLQRGRRYVELLQAAYQEYTGPAITENRDVIVQDQYKKVMIHISGRIMLDPPTLVQQNEYTDLLKPAIDAEIHIPSITDAELLFCNHCVGGFSFRTKRWCLFAIVRMSPVIWNDNAFSKLVMEPRRRDLVHTLVKSHKNGQNTFDDIVSGKGRGLVGLLSGNPGVGKTLTAEVIAEATKRPLYMLSAGELGTCIDEVEKKLDMILEVTRQWGCVLLIDEVDVFLQERDGLNLDRNALVSVFLRRLEYFQGVLIMTTNRKSTIDAAFDSRIHFKLHYPDLSPESRMSIWRTCLDNVPAALVKSELTERELQDLAQLTLNGRQIKNAVACAVSIAAEERTNVTLEGIRIVLDMVVDSGE